MTERMTIEAAAKALGVSPEAVQAYLERTGKLDKVKEGQRVYIPAQAVRALVGQRSSPSTAVQTASVASTVAVPLEKYEQLLTELGRLRTQAQWLETCRTELKEKEALLLEREKELAQLQSEVDRLRKPWWKRRTR